MSASHSHTASLLRKPLNEEDASKEMRKMTAFILQEASEKAAEIKLRADEEFNMEKAKIFRAEMLSIEENHQRKLKALETKKKISHSHALNSSRIKVLSFKEEFISKLITEVQGNVSRRLVDPDVRKQVFKGLLLQSAKYLQNEKHGAIVCMQDDVDMISKVLSEENVSHFKVHLDQRLLSDDIGGLIIIAQGGKIQCNNTIGRRVEQAIKERMPLIRESLFGSSIN